MTEPENLPSASVPGWIAGIPKALVPSSLKAFDRLVGAAIDWPIAYLKRATSKIDMQTKSMELVEAAVANSAVSKINEDNDLSERALQTLMRREYRRQGNREAVATEAMMQINADQEDVESDDTTSTAPIDDDWLNIFERYAEDASTERMQRLWGRVLAGEIRGPGRYSARTLRFLSEFSQSDGELFADLATNTFSYFAPSTLVKPIDSRDISHLLQLEAAGLITGASGLGLTITVTFDQEGYARIKEGVHSIVLMGVPETKYQFDAVTLTKMGEEVLRLLPSRDVKSALRNVALVIRSPQTSSGYVGYAASDRSSITLSEVLWEDQPSAAT